MASYKITWIPRSAYATPLQSDTIFGHLCWAVRYLFDDGGHKLEEVLEELKQRSALLISSAFPKGQLPRPALSLNHGKLARLGARLREEFPGIDDEVAYALNKKARKHPFVEICQLQENSFAYSAEEFQYSLLRQFAIEAARKGEPGGEKDAGLKQDGIEFHNKIDRVSGTTDGTGELFASPVSYLATTMESYLETNLFAEEELKAIFAHIALTGFGKDKNTGKGRFEIKVEPYTWADCPRFNAYLNLSNMVPADTDPVLASCDSGTKFPRVGGDLATTATPFKFPLYVIRPGSVFFAEDEAQRPRGTLLGNVHPDPRIVQNLYSYNIPLLITGS